MTGLAPKTILLNVDTLQLTRALKHLRRCEPRGKEVHLRYDSGTLTVSIGRTSRDVPASGTWIQPVFVTRAWLEALADHPYEAALTDLRQADGILYARDFKVSCTLVQRTEESDLLAKRDEDISHAYQILARYKVTERDVHALVEEADPSTARLWGPNDNLIEDIACAWEPLARHGVEPSDICRLINFKSRDLWQGGNKAAADLFEIYNVSGPEKRALLERGDPAKAVLWSSHDDRMISDVALAWRQLAIYGIEPSEIRRLISRRYS